MCFIKDFNTLIIYNKLIIINDYAVINLTVNYIVLII